MLNNFDLFNKTMHNKNMSKASKLLISVAGCLLVGFIGSLATTPAIPTWYETLNKPFFNPPNWIFGPVWTTLYILMGISVYLIWTKGIKNKKNKDALYFFLIQLGLNFIWSFLFFGFQNPQLAFVEIIFLWAAILITIVKFWKLSKLAAYLLLPYIVWVSFALILNLFIAILN
jgi:benzodiazapine receptor